MKRSLTLLAALSLSAAPFAAAYAQDITGGATLGYGFSDISDLDLDVDTLTFDGRIKVDVGNGISFGARLDAARIDIDGAPDTIGASVIGADVAYAFGNGFSFGVYAEQGKITTDMLPLDITLTSYGVSGGYAFAKGDVSAFVGVSDTSPDLPGNVDIHDFGIAGKYAPMQNLVLAGAFTRTTVSIPGDDMDLDFLGVAAAYDMTPNWTVFAGYANSSIDFGGLDADLDSYGIGVSYDTSALIKVNSFASLELARTDLSVDGMGDGDMDTVRIGLTFPIGGMGTKVPMNSVADAIMNPAHSAVSQTVLAAF
ncbi:porin [Pseudothioclava arenosa]|uniref:Outer membrane protein beta-barrel domain-containing protein n=1 Tax=Pseudothioclava arenosa TaxID=1795308 RepID=A0A2A4CS07_9RHOB|nr:porin [Pseudothioclava arenosa]PCD76916.1 hypothetical protein CLN94_07445 [Pseudothioclava arenosa]